MKYVCGLAALTIMAAVGTEARAQVVVTQGGRSIGIVITGKRPGPIIAAPYGVPIVPVPVYSSFVVGGSFTVIGPSPRPPIVISSGAPPASAPQPPPQGEMDLVNPIIIRPGGGGNDAPMPGAPAGGFRPLRPDDRRNAQQPLPPEGKIERPARPADLKPKEESARQIALGRQAFANQEYGSAANCFQEATRLVPDESLAYFLLAQADLAVGKYREATAAIHEGLRRKADWPANGFRPVELYGPNGADYTEHLEQLRQALNDNQRDPALLFLNAYQLWFDGRQDEARGQFRKALPLVTEPRFIQMFLDRQDGQRVAIR